MFIGLPLLRIIEGTESEKRGVNELGNFNLIVRTYMYVYSNYIRLCRVDIALLKVCLSRSDATFAFS